MINARRLKIYIISTLLILESIVFVNAAVSDKNNDAIIGGADGVTRIFLSETDDNHFSDNLIGELGEGIKNRTELSGAAEDNNGEDNNSADENAEEGNTETEQEENSANDEALKQAIEEAEDKGLLFLVNKQNPVDEDYKPDDLEPIKYYASDRSEACRYMRAEAAGKFHRLVEAAKEDGFTLVMTTAYRSYGFQQILWNNYVANEGEEAASRFSAKPGQSEHQTGLAVDVTSPSVNYELSYSFGETAEGSWLADNAHRFGFIIRFPEGKEDITGYLYEPWHIRYVGDAAAGMIYKEGLTLEEYLQNK